MWESSRRVEKSREEVKRVELRWRRWNNFENCWKELRKLRRAEMAWEELRSGGWNWKGVRQKWRRIHRTELRSSEGPPHLLYRQTLSLDPIASHFLKKLPPPALRGFYFFLNFWTWPLFWHGNFQKWSEPGVFVLYILTWKFGSRMFAPQRRTLFRHLNFQNLSGVGVLCTFWLGHALRAQRHALFRHLNFQKWSVVGVLCTFWLGNVLRATTACTFSSLIWPNGSEPAALASLLFEHPEPHIIGKTQCFAILLPFRAPASSLFWLFLFSDLLSSAHLFSSLTVRISAFPSVHIASKLPSVIGKRFRDCPKAPLSACGSYFQPRIEVFR